MKDKEIKTGVPKTMNVLCYDDKNIVYYDGCITSFEMNTIIDSGMFVDGETYNHLVGYDVYMRVPNLKKHDNIKLDDTTMKRIAKFNKEQECKRLDEEIKEKEEKIKELDDLLQDKEKRWKKIKDYVANIYEIDLDDEEDDYECYD